ncbi:MAG: outer membrane protein assembly factor BamA [Hyphomicrobiales bacterium]|nr:outer membrane protein assembly factor BamA [Hyphomicrobiales bacterium]
MKMCVRAYRGLSFACLLLGGALFASIAPIIPTVTPAMAQSAQTIVVEGNRRVEADTVRSYFRLVPGERLDAAKIDEALKALYATGLFTDVHIREAGGRLIVTVVEAPVINRIAFEGNKRVKDEQLNAEIQSKPRGTFSRAMVQADVQRIVEVYRRAGRYDVRVDPKIIDLPNNRVDLVFEIRDGEKTAVRDINFVGNRAYSAWRLRDVIKTSESSILSFFKNTDIFDPDRLEADRDLLRRFYLKQGYADIRILAAVPEFDPAKRGFVITFTIDEGDLYHFGSVDIQSNVRDVNLEALRARLRSRPGDKYNAEAIEKTTEELAIEVSKGGYAFAQVKPRGDRNYEARLINVVYVIDEGPRAYIERINVRGNTRTRDYVIRREFDIAEGDAFNKVLIDRAERRLKGLGYFKNVKITTEPGSAPDRVVVNVDLEEQSTGEFSVSGGYSTSDGFLAEVSVGERNLLGRGQYAKASVTYGQYAKGFTVSFAEPYFLDQRLNFGVDLFARETIPYTFASYGTTTYGFSTRLGVPLREDFGIQTRYTLYNQSIKLSPQLDNCNNINPDFVNTFPTPNLVGSSPALTPPVGTVQVDCYADGEASLAVKQAALNGPVWISMPGYSLIYNTMNQPRYPTAGDFVEFKQDFAGLGGDVNFIKTSIDARHYYELYPDVVAIFRAQAGNVTAWGGQQVRMLDNFFGGPWLVRGFAPNGFGPRDLTPGTTEDNVGGTNYWGATIEVQTPIPNLPKDVGLRFAVFGDAGNVWNYTGPTQFPQFAGQSIQLADTGPWDLRSSVGAGLIWDSPFGPLRFDYSLAITKQQYDIVQQFRFGGGTKF